MSTSERYTHGYSEAVLNSHARRTVENSLGYGRHLLRPGLRVLDLGCGPGSISAELAALVAPGEVVAVDIDAQVLARARANAAGLPNMTFLEASAYQLSFPDDHFAFSHAHQVLQHLADPVAALRELARVTPSGRDHRGARCRLRRLQLVPRVGWTRALASALPGRGKG